MPDRFGHRDAVVEHGLARERGVRFREAPLPATLRRTIVAPAEGSYDAVATNPQVVEAYLGLGTAGTK